MAQYGQNPQLSFWHRNVGGLSLEHWINDGLMALFFLLIGLELERELYAGELSNVNLIGAGILGGIGFTMSVFIALLAFPGDQRSIDAAKMAILLASLAAGILGYLWLSFACKSGRAHT